MIFPQGRSLWFSFGYPKRFGPISLPHNGAVVTLLAVCGSTHRKSYLDIVMVGIVSALIALVAVIAWVRCSAPSKVMRVRVRS
jgi:hypothetical protein